jgi:hypothetical protein
MAFVRDSNNLIPVMTSNTAPSGTAFSSSQYNVNTMAYMAMNGTLISQGDAWMSNALQTGNMGYIFPSPVIVKYYNLYSQIGQAARAPKNWTFEGSIDGTNWDVLDTRTNIVGWADGTVRKFTLNNGNSYSRYRLNITANNGNMFVSVGELEMCSGSNPFSYQII